MGSAVGERVLVIDDDASVGVLLRHILEGEGYRCTVAATLADARDRLSEATFDVMLCDVRLPDGSGLDLLEEAIPAHPGMAALVISGLDDVALGDRAVRIGAYGYIVKPFMANDVLIGMLGALADRRRELRALDAVREAGMETILTRDRVYRPRFSRPEAIEMLSEGRGTQFDADVLDVLVATLAR